MQAMSITLQLDGRGSAQGCYTMRDPQGLAMVLNRRMCRTNEGSRWDEDDQTPGRLGEYGTDSKLTAHLGRLATLPIP